jgi:S1-C subfamily serine protease
MEVNLVGKLSVVSLSTAIIISPFQLARADTESEIRNTARNITVEVVSLAVNGDQNFTPSGSGVLLKKEGNTYYVITNEHVVPIVEDDYLVIVNNDDPFAELPAEEVKNIEKYPEPDLALLTFTSPQNYEEADLGDPNSLQEGDPVYAAGFPSAVEKRGDWKFTPLRLTNQEPILVGQPLTYQPLQPTNNVEKGMSGGSILNQEGQLVGIHQGETDDRTAGKGIPLNTILATFPLIQREAESPIIVNQPPVNEPDRSLEWPVVRP